MQVRRFAAVSWALLSLVWIGCENQRTPQPETSASVDHQPETSVANFMLAAEPEGARDVIEVRKSAVSNDDVVVVGRIGGSVNTWVDGRAAFSIVDRSLAACSDIEGDACPTPWDYCCETDLLPTSQALVKLVDEQGNLLKRDARELLGVKELQTVVVHGRAQRDDAGNLTVFAEGVYVKNVSPGP